MKEKLFEIVEKLLKLDYPPLIVKEETVRYISPTDNLKQFDTDEKHYEYYCDNKNFYKLVSSNLTMAILFVYNYYQFYFERPHLFNRETVSILKSLFSWIENPLSYFDNNWYPDYIILDGVKYKIRYELILEKV